MSPRSLYASPCRTTCCRTRAPTHCYARPAGSSAFLRGAPMTVADLSIDPETPGLFTRDDYYDVLARLRHDAPVHRYAPHSWVLARYGEVREVSRDPSRFCSGGGVLMHDPLRSGGTINGSILHMDPPQHGLWRKVVSRRFTPRAIGDLERRVRQVAREVLTAVPTGTEIDI